jgi:hypothetical protein
MAAVSKLVRLASLLACSWFLASCVGNIEDLPSLEFKFAEPEYSPPPAVMRRLTREQYANAVHAVFGESIAVPSSVPSDLRYEGLFALGAASARITEAEALGYEAAARSVARQVVRGATRNDVVPCPEADELDSDCAEALARSLGPALYRRSLTDEEALELRTLAETVFAIEPPSTERAFEAVISAMLQASSFLFRPEFGELPAGPSAIAYDGPTMASRLSYFLWGEAPDEALREAAATGKLEDDETLRFEVQRMLDDPRARKGMELFFRDMLDLDRLFTAAKNAAAFPHFVSTYANSALGETLRFLEWLVFDEQADFREALTSRTTFVDPLLSSLYRVRAPAAVDGFQLIELPESARRRGLLGHASLLALHSHVENTSSTLRGHFIAETLLCIDVPAPPPFVDTVIPAATEEAPTLRDRMAVHLETVVCSSCHGLLDPIGLALENFDAVGQFRTHEGTALIDASGVHNGQPFEDAYELAGILAEDPAFARCVVRTLFRYGNGRVERSRDTRPLRELGEQFAESGFRLKALLEALVTHQSFREFDPSLGELEVSP